MSSTYLDWTGDALDSALWQGIEFLEIEFVLAADVIVETIVTANLARPSNGIGPNLNRCMPKGVSDMLNEYGP